MSEVSHPSPTTTAPASPLSGKVILLVEDEAFIAELLTSWLGRLGARILWGNTGAEGIRLLTEQAGHVDVIIADFRLPDMTGDDMCVKMRELQPQVPVLLSSGRYQGQAEKLLSDTGPTFFIQKPYSLDDVFGKLKKLSNAG